MKPILACLLLSLATVCLRAQNPIIRDQFTADPTARVFNGRMYLYPSHDIPAPDDFERKDWFCMADYHVFSSDNLVDWTDHGVIVTQNSVPWVEPDSYSMWAPDCVEKNGTYYFYFPSAPRGKRGFGIGVAMAERPEGPFRPMFRPIEGAMGIDPCVLVDDDGQAYIYWSGMGLRVARLKDNMMQLDSEPQLCEGLPEGFKEGPFAFKRQGRYYLTFPWVRGKKGDPGPDGKPLDNHTETLAYAMSDSPLGPWRFQGVIMAEWPNQCWTNHHSIVEYRGQWYIFYHHNDLSPQFDKNRSACIDSLCFNPDGTIQPVQPTLRGVGVTDARTRIQIDRYSHIGGGASVDYINSAMPFEGWKTVLRRKGAWVAYSNVDFGTTPVQTVTVKARSKSGARLSLKSGTGNAVAITVPAKTNDWTLVTTTCPLSVTGLADITLSLLSGACEVDWVGFDALPWNEGAFKTGRYRNLFAELGYSQSDIDAKVDAAFNDLFYGPNRIYFEVGDSMAYISDIKNHDVRTEGMSYGMMIAVQMDRKDIFDRLWRWSKHYMQHQTGERKGYFAWSCKTDGTHNAQGAASDGELYYITSLIFAHNRWGGDYLRQAQHILDCSMQKAGMDNAAPLVNLQHKLITFTPDRMGGRFTDPSYHIPAFYEVWARWADDGRAAFWYQCAEAARQYLHRCVHPVTALAPDYSNYDGTLLGMNRSIGDAFRFDSWRVPMNIALDYSWSCADGLWQREYADRLQAFLYAQGIDTYVDQYNIDGTAVADTLGAGTHKQLRHSTGLVATAGAVSLCATHPRSREFADRLWTLRHEPYADGYFDAYYDGLLRLFALMHLSGRYRIITPQ